MVESHASEGLRRRANGANTDKVLITEEGKETDQRLDKHETYVRSYLICILQQLPTFS